MGLWGPNGTTGDGPTCPMAKEIHQAVLAASAIILQRNNSPSKQGEILKFCNY